MDYAEYYDVSHKASAMAELEQLDEAIEAFAKLVKTKDLATLDRSVMAYNVSLLYVRKKNLVAARQWLDLAVDFEKPLLRLFALEHLASFCYTHGEKAESLRLYEELLAHPAATEAEKSRFITNIAALKAEALEDIW